MVYAYKEPYRKGVVIFSLDTYHCRGNDKRSTDETVSLKRNDDDNNDDILYFAYVYIYV